MRTCALAFASALSCLATAQFQWTQLPDFPGTARDDAASFTIGAGSPGNTYVGTGMEVGWGLTNDWFRFNDWQWEQVASLPATPRQYCAAIAVNDKGYLFGGIDASGALNELWRYDPSMDLWEQLPSLPSEGRYASVAFDFGGDGLYIAYGILASGQPTREVWRFRLQTGLWELIGEAPAPARHRAAVDGYAGGTIYGGMDADGNVLSEAWRPDPNGNGLQWTSLPDMPEPRFGARAAFGILVGGASSWSMIHDNVWRFNGQSWSVLDPFPGGARRGGVVGWRCCLGGSIRFGLGLDDSMTRRQDWWTMEVFNSTEEHAQSLFQIWPNPVVDVLRCEWSHGASSVPYAVVDAAGREIASGHASNGGAIDASLLRPGVYSLVLNLGSSVAQRKFIKLP